MNALLTFIDAGMRRLFLPSHIIREVKASNERIMRISNLMACISLLLGLAVSSVRCYLFENFILFWISVFQLIVTLYIFSRAFNQYKLIHSYFIVYGLLLLTLSVEVFSHGTSTHVEQRLLFSNSILLIITIVSGIVISPIHIIVLGSIILIRLLILGSLGIYPFIQSTLIYGIILNIFIMIGFYVPLQKIYKVAYQFSIQNSIIVRKNRELMELVKFKQEMTSMILHDIRNPLNNILFLVREKQPSALVTQSVQNILWIADNFIDLHRFEEGRINLNLSSKNVTEIIRKAIGQVSYLMNEKHNNIRLSVPATLYLNIDHCLFERVFINILSNSIKYALPNSSVLFHCHSEEKYVRFEISNNGKAIHPEDVKIVFEQFVSKDEASNTANSSKGLGLRLCKIVVEAHGGEIGFSTNYPNNGTLMWIVLPHQNETQVESDSKTEVLAPVSTLNLSLEEMKFLKPYAKRLSQFQMCEAGLIVRVLNEIVAAEKSLNMECWKNEVLNAALSNNKKYFRQLMAMVDS